MGESISTALAVSLSRRRWLQQVGLAGGVAFLSPLTRSWGAEEAKQGASSATKLITRQADPYNAEPPLAVLANAWITPNELFYVRNHGATPKLKADDFTLTISGLVDKPLVLKVSELLERFPRSSAIATLTCAGNRRREFYAEKEVPGVPWEAGAIGNARWSGVPLSALLEAAHVQSGARHVWFEGADELQHGGETIHFGGSIPIEKALSDKPGAPGALLATEMNEQPLTPDHGFPLRSIVPGYIGARSVKWLNRIVVSNQPSPNHYLAEAYKLVTGKEGEDVHQLPPLYENVINGAICTPAAGVSLEPGRALVAGYALPSGKPGCTITKVEISTDGGKNWQSARLGEKNEAWCWRLWEANVEVTRATQELIARVTDSSGATQPQRTPWNAKGYMYNAWYRTPVKI